MQTNRQQPSIEVDKSGPFARSLPMGLQGGPISTAAKAFVEELASLIASNGRQTTRQKVVAAMGALMADLFDLHRGRDSDPTPIPGGHGMSPSDFSSGKFGFGHSIFKRVTDALRTHGYLELTLGKPKWRNDFGTWHSWNGQITTFVLTGRAIAEASKRGVDVDKWTDHWTESTAPSSAAAPEHDRLVLKASKQAAQGQKVPAEKLSIPEGCPIAARLRQEMDELNRAILGHEITGISFPGLQRIFNDGDVEDYAWDRGGRFYSLPGGRPYEQLPSVRRLERIRMNGQRVCEVDIRASHLTILHALLQEPMKSDDDPYEIEGVERTVAKQWCTHVLGSGKSSARRWGDEAKKAYSLSYEGRSLQTDFPMAKVGQRVMAKHPVFLRLEEAGLQSVNLQFHESEVLRLAMMELLQANVPVLPMHDALIVPHAGSQDAADALRQAFATHVIKVTGSAPEVALKTSLKA